MLVVADQPDVLEEPKGTLVSETTYYVSIGTINPTHSLTH